MLSKTKIKAVELLFEHTDGEVARKLRIRCDTLDAWKQDPEFIQALYDRLLKNRQSAVRILSELYAEMSGELAGLIRYGDDNNARIKLLVDVLKVAGLFKLAIEAMTGNTEEGDGIGNLLERLAGGPEVEPGEED